MTFSGTLSAILNLDLVNAGDISTAKDQPRKTLSAVFADGTGINQANNVYHAQRLLTTGQSEDLDLAGGGLLNPFGNALTFTKVKAIVIFALAANTTILTLSRPTNGLPFFGAVGDALDLKPGGIFMFIDPSAAGVAVTGGSADLVRVANASGASASYQIIIVGTT